MLLERLDFKAYASTYPCYNKRILMPMIDHYEVTQKCTLNRNV